MLRFVSGVTGAGKSKFMVDKIIDYIRHDERPIFYYFALRLEPWVNGRGTSYPGLVWTMHSRFGVEPEETRRRLVELPRDKIHRFWAYRAKVQRTPFGLVDKCAAPVCEDIPPLHDGSFGFDDKLWQGGIYIIDEAHEFFRKADFAKVAPEGISWASQNRRAGDEAWLLTQQAENVAKPFRVQSTECYWLVNHGHRVFACFREPEIIRYRQYLQTPPGAEPPIRSGRLDIDKALLHGCYDTAAGASVSGGGADIGYRPKGLSWRWIPVFALIAILAIWLSWRGLLGALGWGSRSVVSHLAPVNVSARAVPTDQASPQTPPPVPPARPEPPPGRPATVASNAPPADKVTGLVGRPGAYTVYLASGERIPARHVQNFGGSVWADGHEYRWAH